MKGKYSVRVENRNVRFDFEIERNITIIRGNSGTGKTTLVDLVMDYQLQGSASGVSLICSRECVTMSSLGNRWQQFLDSTHGSIVFIDEGEQYVRTKEFASYIKNTDNYYVISTRDNLYDIPYSVDSIYELKTSGKYGKLKKVYNRLKRVYTVHHRNAFSLYSDVVVEDSNSGYQFFQRVCEWNKANCRTAGGKSKIFTLIKKLDSKAALVVADGAAFGPEMTNVYEFCKLKEITLFLPESFEWMILRSGIIKGSELKDILERPYDFIESKKFFSWETFFTKKLIDMTKEREYAYSKKKLPEYYMSERSVKRIMKDFFEDF